MTSALVHSQVNLAPVNTEFPQNAVLLEQLGTQFGLRLKKCAGKMLMHKGQNPDIPDTLFTIEALKDTTLM